MPGTIPISVIIPTRNRASVLKKSLDTWATQGIYANEIIIIDGSDDDETKKITEQNFEGLTSKIIYLKATILGAAAQRNQGIAAATQPFLLFADDDVYLEDHCLERLWNAINSDESIGGVNAMITNQRYLPMGTYSSTVAGILYGKRLNSYAGKALIPGWGILPEDRPDMPEIVPVEWLNLGATIYRKKALPSPVFDPYFAGYSLAEDLALSVTVGRNWKLMNVRTARIYHDSQPGSHKSNMFRMAEMDMMNRHYIMTHVLGKKGLKNYFKLLLFEIFQWSGGLTSKAGLKYLPASAAGRIVGFFKAVFQ